jgi:FKBP-type peptidyl-prolyl cis-trans isomerase
MRVWAATGLIALALTATDVGAKPADLTPIANQTYLANNAVKAGVTVRPSGLQYRILRSGNGRSPSATDTVLVAYKGQLIDGTVFDQRTRDNPISFQVNQVIPGWTEALEHMRVGDQWHLVIPANLAYGARGAGDAVPPDQTLIFDVELLAIE